MDSWHDGWSHSSAVTALDKLEGETTLRDFTIASKSGKEWKMHKLVLYMHSDVLYRMATSEDFIECQTGRAILKDAEDRCIEAMVDYFYTANIKRLYCLPNVDEEKPDLTTEDIKHLTT